MPILPTVLVNGAEGIGTGWSTSIPNYNPHDIVNNIKRLMNGEEQVRVRLAVPYLTLTCPPVARQPPNSAYTYADVQQMAWIPLCGSCCKEALLPCYCL